MYFINWRDYLIDSPSELKNILSETFLEAEYFIACASNYYRLQISIPTIVVYESTNNNSAICYDNKAIVVYQGLLKYLFINEGDKLQATLEERVNHFLWIIGHEYFHYARRHNVVKREIANTFRNVIYREIDKKIYAQVIEDDADRLATAALYRHFKCYKYKNNNSFKNKQVVLSSLFEPIRLKISGTVEQNSMSNKHPVWSARLYSQIIKLSELDTRDPNELLTLESETISQQKILEFELLKLERAYLDKKGEPENDLLNQYLVSHNRFIDLNKLNFYAKKNYKLIYKNSTLLGLKGQTREWTCLFISKFTLTALFTALTQLFYTYSKLARFFYAYLSLFKA